jgi:hypothetical protein
MERLGAAKTDPRVKGFSFGCQTRKRLVTEVYCGKGKPEVTQNKNHLRAPCLRPLGFRTFLRSGLFSVAELFSPRRSRGKELRVASDRKFRELRTRGKKSQQAIGGKAAWVDTVRFIRNQCES